MNPVFICYHRSDSQAFARTLRNKLIHILGAKKVWLDESNIDHGTIIPTRIQRSIDIAGTLVVLIGPNWLSARSGRVRRLHQRTDWVRQEIVRAMNRGILVLPVLIAGATLPAPSQLPKSLRPLSKRLALDASRLTATFAAKKIAARARKDGFNLSIAQVAKYAGDDPNDPNEDWWNWTVRLKGPKAQLDSVSSVTYRLYESFTPPVVEVFERETGFALDREGFDDFRIKIRVAFDDGRRVELHHELILS